MTWTPPRQQRNVARTTESGHGLTLEATAHMYAQQAGRCLICVRALDRELLVIDHDHALAALHGHRVDRGCRRCVRGLICTPCNTLLGIAKDDPETLRRAASYVELARQAAR